jgi:hypothetical protein
MFEPQIIERAVDLQQRSYALLTWMTTAIDRGFITFDAAHNYATLPEATLAWLDSHYLDVPAVARPSRDDLREFANLFATYLEASFDLVDDPGQRLYSPDAHCFCPQCSWLVPISRLQAKKLARRDKERARSLQMIAVKQLGHELDIAVSDEHALAIAQDAALRETVALVAYGHDLLRRLKGVTEGAASLALWRGFAWTATGAPRPRFKLTAEAILEAEATVIRTVRSLEPAPPAG